MQTGDFNKTSTQTGQQDNWGLTRHINETNYYGSSTAHNSSYNYDYVLDGTGVDMVIMDTGIPSRSSQSGKIPKVQQDQQIDWFAESGVTGTQP